MVRDDVVKQFVRMLSKEYEQLLDYNINVNEICGTDDTILVLRARHAKVFVNFLKFLKKQEVKSKLIVIGKTGDEELLQKNYDGEYELIVVEGTYTTDKILEHKEVISKNSPKKLLVLTRMINSGDFINIYEVARDIGSELEIYNVDDNCDVAYINNIEKYVTLMKLNMSLMDWYWEAD